MALASRLLNLACSFRRCGAAMSTLMASSSKKRHSSTDDNSASQSKRQRATVASLSKTTQASSPTAADDVQFYEGKGPFAALSNFYVHTPPLQLDGKTYTTLEHFFQASKFMQPGADEATLAYAEAIRLASTPNKCKVLAQQKTGGGYAWRTSLNPDISAALAAGVTLRPDWENVKVEVMRSGLFEKFTQDVKCRQMLLATGQRRLVEHTTRDRFWGDGGDGKGQNQLGLLLEEVRHKLREGNKNS